MSSEEESQPAGLLAPLGNPLGAVLKPILKPTVGSLTGAIGEPAGDAMRSVQVQAKREKGYEDEEKPESEWWGGKALGGGKVGGGNPLGLGK